VDRTDSVSCSVAGFVIRNVTARQFIWGGGGVQKRILSFVNGSYLLKLKFTVVGFELTQ
jgi:hypothetical protein